MAFLQHNRSRNFQNAQIILCSWMSRQKHNALSKPQSWAFLQVCIPFLIITQRQEFVKKLAITCALQSDSLSRSTMKHFYSRWSCLPKRPAKSVLFLFLDSRTMKSERLRNAYEFVAYWNMRNLSRSGLSIWCTLCLPAFLILPSRLAGINYQATSANT